MISFRKILNNKIQLFFFSMMILFIVFAVIGAIFRYSPVPFSDMWGGYIGWYLQDNWQGLWAFHNEHRIILARLIYWLDVVLFNNSVWFLIAVNYILLSIVCYLFALILRDQANLDSRSSRSGKIGRRALSEERSQLLFRCMLFFLIAWLFAWPQHENLDWGFQNQFINAQLLPLCSFYLLYRSSIASAKSKLLFFWSCFFGILSLGTMANGALALPMLTVYALIIRQSWQRIIILFVLSASLLFLYFYDFHQPDYHSSLANSLINSPYAVLQYSLLYLGNPFTKMFHQMPFVYLQPFLSLAGLILVSSACYFGIKYLIKNILQPHDPKIKLQLMLVLFIFFITITAIGTAGGRIIFGLESALASRYMTPSIMAWAAFYILYFPAMSFYYKKYGKLVLLPLMLILLFLLPYELHAIKNKNTFNFDKQIAALAIELRVRDQEKIHNVVTFMDQALDVAAMAEKKNFIISGMEKLQGMREQLGQLHVPDSAIPPCAGEIEIIDSLLTDPKFLRISGWVKIAASGKIPDYIQFLDPNNHVIGYALTGGNRRERFEGYMLNYPWKTIKAIGAKQSCQVILKVPIMEGRS